MADLVNGWWQTGTAYLTREHEDHNAENVYRYFRSLGWTKNAIAGMCGNMHVESRINPGLWQGRTVPSNPMTTSKGFGLTQWTPARKYIEWAIEQGHATDYANGNLECDRIKWEWQNKKQWSLNNLGNHTWNDFVYSTETPEKLARVFCWAYERPSNPNMELRQENARYYFNLFERLDPSPGPTPDPPIPPDPDINPDDPNPPEYTNGLTIDQLLLWLSEKKGGRHKIVIL